MRRHGPADPLRPGNTTLVVATLVSIAALTSCGLLKRNLEPPRAILEKSDQAQYVESETCYVCHDDVFDDLKGSLHEHVPLEKKPGNRMCETCHGPAGNHVESYDPADIFGIEDWAKLDNQDRDSACLSCHKTKAALWSRSPHDNDEISCFNCHDDAFHIQGAVKGPVVDPAKIGGPPDKGQFCLQCHPDVQAQFSLQVTHPVDQGTMGCTDCHGPHGEEQTVESVVDVSEVCTKCHTEVKGPFVYEHDAMTEGCTSCHSPHGSPNPKLLVQTGNGLCLQCHVDALYPRVNGMDHSLFVGSGASCIQCHFEVHGSNTSETLAPGN